MAISKKPYDIRNRSGQFTKKRFERRDIYGRFSSKKKKPPIRYLRPVPDGMTKITVSLIHTFEPGTILEFVYGEKQKPGQVGGWKNDRRPVLLIFMDDGFRYIEGLNTNYLSPYYMKKLQLIQDRFPGFGKDGRMMYKIVWRTGRFAIQKGYRKYIRTSLRDRYIYVYKDKVTQTLEKLAQEDVQRRIGGP